MQDYDKSSATMNSEGIRRKRPRLKLVVLVALTILLTMAGCGVGAWFGGQWVERRQWEAKSERIGSSLPRRVHVNESDQRFGLGPTNSSESAR